MVPEPLGLKSVDQAWLTFVVALRLGVTGDGDEEIGVARGWRASFGGGAAVHPNFAASGAAGGTSPASARVALYTGIARASAASLTSVRLA